MESKEEIAKKLIEKGAALALQGKVSDAIAAYDEVVLRFGDDDSPGVRKQVARALRKKGDALELHEDEPCDAIAAYDEVVRRFGDDDSPGVRKQVAKALLDKGFASNKCSTIIEVCDEVVRRFGDDDSPGVREKVAEALLRKGVCLSRQANWFLFAGNSLRQQGKSEEEIAAYIEKSTTTSCKSEDAIAAHDKIEEAIAAYAELIRRFGNDDSSGVRKKVEWAFRNIVDILEYQGESAETAYDEFFRRFGNDTSPGMRRKVSTALLFKGNTLVH